MAALSAQREAPQTLRLRMVVQDRSANDGAFAAAVAAADMRAMELLDLGRYDKRHTQYAAMATELRRRLRWLELRFTEGTE